MTHRPWHKRSNIQATLAATVMFLTLLTVGCDDGRKQRERESTLIAQVDSLRALFASTQDLRHDFGQRARPVLVSEDRLRDLQRQGLADPLVDLANSLRSHPEVLPQNLVAEWGGKFGFYNPEGIHLLTTKWVLAEFDDGHGVGHMLLEFTVRDSGKVEWKPIAWAVDD